MNIAARIGVWSGKKLPFDVVEYIRRPIGGATVRWTLPFRPEDNDVISWTASIEDAASSWTSAGFMSYNSEYVEATRVIKSGVSMSRVIAYFRARASGGGTDVSVAVASVSSYILSHGQLVVNGERHSITEPSSISESRGQYVLLSNNGNTLYGFKLARGEDILCDLTPVRFRDVDGSVAGGFYDSVSGEILTHDDGFDGAYEIGPVKTGGVPFMVVGGGGYSHRCVRRSYRRSSRRSARFCSHSHRWEVAA